MHQHWSQLSIIINSTTLSLHVSAARYVIIAYISMVCIYREELVKKNYYRRWVWVFWWWKIPFSKRCSLCVQMGHNFLPKNRQSRERKKRRTAMGAKTRNHKKLSGLSCSICASLFFTQFSLILTCDCHTLSHAFPFSYHKCQDSREVKSLERQTTFLLGDVRKYLKPISAHLFATVCDSFFALFCCWRMCLYVYTRARGVSETASRCR